MKLTDERFRHELKYLCRAGERSVLECRARGLLTPDSHTGADGAYQIRSLYFDDYGNSCYYDNLNGVPIKEKFRLRIYGGSSHRISLELKRNEYGMTQKLSCLITEEQCRALMAGEQLPQGDFPPLLNRLLLKRKNALLHPVVIVEYNRIPFVYDDGNVRVTFDCDVSASGEVGSFLEKQISLVPVMPKGFDILEVKYDAFIPEFIRTAMEIDRLPRTSFSKYFYCRRALMGGSYTV